MRGRGRPAPEVTTLLSDCRASGTHTQTTFFCQNLDAEVADLRARGVKLEEFDMPGATVQDGVYDMNGQRGAWFRDPEGNLLAGAADLQDLPGRH